MLKYSIIFVTVFLFSSNTYSREFEVKTKVIDIPKKAGCKSRNGKVQLLLSVGYKYYDYEYIEYNASPKPGDVTVTPNPTKTGADISWNVPSLNISSGDLFCIGKERSWLKAQVNVRGIKE
jgi:hypothetical protein